jgi:crossover junction endodeoxyribonuclease RuvC
LTRPSRPERLSRDDRDRRVKPGDDNGRALATFPTRILGIDPGLRRTGWGLVTIEGTRLAFVGCGTVTSNDKAGLAERLRQLHDGLAAVLRELSPDEVAVEETFVNKDAQATLKLGHARGIALLVPALAGHAEKRQIHAMVRVLLPKADPASDDAADALAIAITHAHHRKARALTGE